MEDLDEQPKLLFNYIFDQKEPCFDQILVDNKKYSFDEVKNKQIKLSFNEIEKEYGSKIAKLELKISNNFEIHNFEIISGLNIGILFPLRGCTKDIIFPDNNTYKIKIRDLSTHEVKEFDVKKRLLLLNFSHGYDLYVNDKLLTNEIINLSGGKSTQISILDLDSKIFLSKKILIEQFDSFLEAYNKYHLYTNDFLDSLRQIRMKKKFDVKEYKNLFDNDEIIDILFYKYNLPKKILKTNFKSKEYFEFLSICCLYLVMHKLEEKEEIESTYEYFMSFKKELEKDKNLENYMRNIIIIEFSILLNSKGLDKFKNLNFKYYNTNSIENDSPLKNAMKFLDQFIKDLDENSPFIYPLILIDSGNYQFDNENAYGYGLISNEILKSHLENVLPDIIITITDIETKSKETVSNKVLSSVILNLESKYLSQLKSVNINKKILDKNKNDRISLILFIIFFHEIFGHKKGAYSTKNNIFQSPRVFYDKKKKKILKLVNRNNLYLNDNEVPILREELQEQDSGHFLEYFIGECEYGFYSEMIDKLLMNDINLNFIFDVNMWNKKIEIMRNYIKLKYIIFNYNKELLDNKKYKNIDDEICELKEIINKNKISKEDLKEINNSKNSNKKEINEKNNKTKKSELSKIQGIININYEKYKNLPYNELREMTFSSKTPEDLKKVLYEILLSRIMKK